MYLKDSDLFSRVNTERKPVADKCWEDFNDQMS